MFDWQEMKESYIATKKTWEEKRRELTKYRDELIEQNAYNNEYDDELKIIGSMIGDLEYVIEWLNTGRRPGNMRGIERRSVYQNTVLWDPTKFEYFVHDYQSRSASTLTDDDRRSIKSALEKLTDLEREVFVKVKGMNWSVSEVANELAISRGSVDKMIKRAMKKFEQGWQEVLF